MRPLRPGALPSDTSLRFALVLAAVVAASLYLFQAMWFLIRGRTFLDVVVACMDRAGTDQVVTSEAFDALLGRGEACRADVSREQAGAVLLGVLAVLVVAWALYRTWPGWRERRRHLVALDDPESALLRALGLQASGLRLMLLIESLLIAAVSVLVGVVFGVLLGWVGAAALVAEMGLPEPRLVVDWGVIGLVVAGVLLAAAAASVLPGRRAAQAAPVEALADVG